jgi:acetoin utilization protein AcuB
MQVHVPVTRDVLVIPPSISVANGWKLLGQRHIRHLPVVSDGKLVGIISDRDCLRLAHNTPSGELAFVDRAVGDIMTLDPVVCAPTDTVAEVCRVMIERKIDSLPVVADGRLVGLVTSTDLLELLVHREKERLPFAFHVELAGTA